jgi:hypothetical protein
MSVQLSVLHLGRAEKNIPNVLCPKITNRAITCRPKLYSSSLRPLAPQESRGTSARAKEGGLSALVVTLDRRAVPVGSGSLVGKFILAVKTPALWISQEYLHKGQDELKEVELNGELKENKRSVILKVKDMRRISVG